LQVIEQPLFLPGGKVKYLFVHVAVVVPVEILKLPVILYSQFIIVVAPGKVEVEVGLAEIEHTVIKSIVKTVNRIVYPESAVAESRV